MENKTKENLTNKTKQKTPQKTKNKTKKTSKNMCIQKKKKKEQFYAQLRRTLESLKVKAKGVRIIVNVQNF